MKIVFLAYRDWALNVVRRTAVQHSPKIQFVTISSPEGFSQWEQAQDIDATEVIIIAVGWSWIIDARTTERFLCLGIHPSDLPYYRGGSPIQNQIIDGVVDTQCSLFRITSKLDAGEIWGKTAMKLDGNSMDEILLNVEAASVRLLSDFIRDYPNISTVAQDLSLGSYAKRRKPEDSRISQDELDLSDITPLYNKIRCLTAPYPNAYIEDSHGNRIYFEKISFAMKEVKK